MNQRILRHNGGAPTNHTKDANPGATRRLSTEHTDDTEGFDENNQPALFAFYRASLRTENYLSFGFQSSRGNKASGPLM